MSPRVLVFGAWDEGPGYPRTTSILQSFHALGWEVSHCRRPSLLLGRRKAELARRPWCWPLVALATLREQRAARAAVHREVERTRPDLVYVPYPGHTWVRAARAALTGPVLLDLFLSVHDTVAEDRRLVRAGGLAAQLLRRLDRRACAAADLVLLDTEQHVARVAELTGLPLEHFACHPVGDPDAPEVVAPYLPPRPDEPLRVLFFGTGVPLHGLDVLVRAVRRCQGRVTLQVIGGSARDRAAIRAASGGVVTLLDTFVSRAELEMRMQASHLVAGVFGRSRKAQLVVPFKVVHGLAAGRPVLTADTPAIRSVLRVGEEVLVAPAGDSDALALELSRLAATPALLGTVAGHARGAFERRFSAPALARQLGATLARLGFAENRAPSRAEVVRG